MAIKKYYDSDCNLGVLDGKTVAVIGFGSQGHAHSENLAESGVNVVVGLRKGSAHWEKASEFAATHENFKVMEVEEAAKAERVLGMSKGKVVLEGTPKEVFSQTEKVRSLRLDVPQAAELRDELVKAGIPMPEGIIDTGECALALYELLK